MRGRTAVIAALAAAVVACRGDAGPAGGAADVPVREARVTLELGDVEGPAEYVFGAVSGLALDGAGRIVVADGQASELRAYDTDGTFLYRVAGSGEGPGEVLSPCCLGRDGEGTVWVRDGGNARYSGFRTGPSSAEFVEVRRMLHGATNFWAPLHFRGDSLIDAGMAPGDDGRTHRVRHLLAPDGGAGRLPDAQDPDLEEIGAGRTVDRRTADGAVRLFLHIPFGPAWLAAPGPDGLWADAVSSEYRIRIVGPDGDAVVVEGPSGRGPELSADERERAGERIEEYRHMVGQRVDLNVPAAKPILAALFFDADGRLWVARSVGPGEPRRADLHAPDGTLLERREWPGDVRLDLIGWTQGDVALGVRADELGVQRVVRLEWGGAPEG